MSDLIARLAARATGAPVVAPAVPRSLGGIEQPARETPADGGSGRPDPTAVDRRDSAEGDPGRPVRPEPAVDAGTVVAAHPRLPRMMDTVDPAVREEVGTSDRPSVPWAARTGDSGPRIAERMRSPTDTRRPFEPSAEPGADAPHAVTGTPPADEAHPILASEHGASREPDPLPHVAVARPRSDPSHSAAGVDTEPEPIVRVHIERLEVRAAPEPTRRFERRAAPTPAVSLSEYLRGRREAP